MIFERPDWWQDAACRGLGLFLFFGAETDETVAERRRREMQAKAVCQKCPVKVECLADALKFGDEGVRGGLTRYERAQVAPRIEMHGEWVLIAHSAGLKGSAQLERRQSDLDATMVTFRVVKRGRVVKQTADETEAWIALHNADL